MSDPQGIIGIYRKGGGIMETINQLVNEIYMDNEQHLEYMENMNGGDCDCFIHKTLNMIVAYQEGLTEGPWEE
jgi:hypothetical protein